MQFCFAIRLERSLEIGGRDTYRMLAAARTAIWRQKIISGTVKIGEV